MTTLMELVKGRKSVRSFDGRKLTAEDLDKLKAYGENLTNPFGIPVKLVFLDAETEKLSSPVLIGEKNYVAGIVPKKDYADVAFGYAFEAFVLYAWSLGIGTTWIAGTMKRDQFEAAAGLQKGDMMPCISPLGYPAKKRSVKEVLMRKGIGADTRMPAEKLFFEEDFNTPLTREKKSEISDLIELVRWAPSAVNKQPWRIVIKDGCYHFYVKHDRGYINDETGDLQKIDVGIALYHFAAGLEEAGQKPEIICADPGIAVPEGVEYVAGVSVH